MKSDPFTVGPITLEHISAAPLWGRMSRDGTLHALWAFDPHTDNKVHFHRGINITHDAWADAHDRFRLLSRHRELASA